MSTDKPPTYVVVPPFGLMELGADGTLRRDMGGPSLTVRYESGDFVLPGSSMRTRRRRAVRRRARIRRAKRGWR